MLLGVSMLIVLPCLVGAVASWVHALVHLRRSWSDWPKKRHRALRLATVPPLLGLMALLFQLGVAIPKREPPPGATAIAANVDAWNAAADKLAQDHKSLKWKARIIDGVTVDNVRIDPAGGVWLQTRSRPSNRLFGSHYDGVVRSPKPGFDPIGNHGGPSFKPISDGWYIYTTEYVD